MSERQLCRAQAQSSGEGGLLTGCPLQGDRGGVRAAVRSAVSTPSVRGPLPPLCVEGLGLLGGPEEMNGETAARLVSSQLGSRRSSLCKDSCTSFSESCD